MRIAVCMKQVPNPDALAAVLRVDEAALSVVLNLIADVVLVWLNPRLRFE